MKPRLFFLFLFNLMLISGFSQPFTVVINEFLAKNTLGPVDNAGELEDWIELFNYGTDTVDIAGCYMTDKLNQPTLWQIPTGSALTRIPPLGFLLLWADEDLTQGVLHLDFKLSNDGEAIGLLSPAQVWLDSLSFGVQMDDVSYGRSTDGGAAWQTFPTPTPGVPNNPGYLLTGTGELIYSSNGNGPSSLEITSNVNWTVSCAQSWVGFSPSSGNGNGTLTLSIDPNPNPSARSASLVIAGTGVPAVSVVINQLGNTPTLVVSTTLLEINSPAGSLGTFDLLSNLSWTITCPDSWLGFLPASGSDNASIQVTALTENPQSTDRSTIITVSAPGVSDRLIDVTQLGTPPVPILFINEILSSSTQFTDNYGEAEDFIEIYNPGPETVNLAGLYLTDDAANPTKWQIPAGNDSTILDAGEWLVFWADEDTQQGVLHSNFKLSANGEFAGLFVNPFYPVDSLTFPVLQPDASFGRLPDGSSTWGLCQPTPGAANLTLIGLNENPMTFIHVFPNPVKGELQISNPLNESLNFRLFDLAGREYFLPVFGQKNLVADLHDLPDGFYLLQLTSSAQTQVFRLLKK